MSEHDHEHTPQMLFFGANGRPMTAQEFKVQQDRAQASSEAFWADLKRLLFAELDEDQLHTLKHAFRLVGESDPDRACQLANYFEGLAAGAEHVKHAASPLTLEFQEAQERAESTLWSHPFRGERSGACRTCGTPESTKPHRRWDEGLRGDGSDGLDV